MCGVTAARFEGGVRDPGDINLGVTIDAAIKGVVVLDAEGLSISACPRTLLFVCADKNKFEVNI